MHAGDWKQGINVGLLIKIVCILFMAAILDFHSCV